MKIMLYVFIETHLGAAQLATQRLQLCGEWQKTKRRAHYGCQHFNEPLEECGATSLLLCSCGKIWQGALKKWQAEAERKDTWSFNGAQCEMRDQKCSWTMCSHQGSLEQKLTDFDYRQHRKP